MTQPPQRPTSSDTVTHYLSPARLAPYLRATDGHRTAALSLYRWNVAMSGALHEVLHVAEVVLRNAIDEQLRAWNADHGHGKDWLITPQHLLERLVGRELHRHRAQAAKTIHHRAPTHDDLVAATSLGMWVTLLPGSGKDAGKRRLWNDTLHHAFPHLAAADPTGRALTRDAHTMLQLRNRVAHLEPLLDQRRVTAGFDATKRVLTSIDPTMLEWAMASQRVTDIQARRPANPPCRRRAHRA